MQISKYYHCTDSPRLCLSSASARPCYYLERLNWVHRTPFDIKYVKTGEAPGPSGIVSELCCYARHPTPDEPNPLLVPSLLSLLKSSFSLCHIPADIVSLMTPIFKKCDSTQACNYMPIAVSDPILELYAGIWNQRLVSIAKEYNSRSPARNAFRPHLSTLHPTFALQTMIELAKSKRKTLYCRFLNLKSAYDTVGRILCCGLYRLGLVFMVSCFTQSSLCMLWHSVQWKVEAV